MQENIFKLGHANNRANDIGLKDDSVSQDHLKIEWINKDTLRLTDLDSTNGTWVNGSQIVSKVIQSNDAVIIGKMRFIGSEIIEKIEILRNRKKVIFYDEFESLKTIFEEFDLKKRKLKSSNVAKSGLLRYSVIGLLFVLFYFVGVIISLPQELRYGVSLFGGVIAIFVSQKFLSAGDQAKKMEELREEYDRQLRCPGCRKQSLIGKSYGYWVKIRKCQKCQANWVR